MFLDVCGKAHHAEILHPQRLIRRVGIICVAVAPAWLGRFVGVEDTSGNIYLRSTKRHHTGIQRIPGTHILQLIFCRQGCVLLALAAVIQRGVWFAKLGHMRQVQGEGLVPSWWRGATCIRPAGGILNRTDTTGIQEALVITITRHGAWWRADFDGFLYGLSCSSVALTVIVAWQRAEVADGYFFAGLQS